MKLLPILFNDEMVRAVLEGEKTQTRRPLKPQPSSNITNVKCPYGEVGDWLWVGEAFYIITRSFKPYRQERVIYRATTKDKREYEWTPASHMPECASRIFLEVVNIRAEKVQSISNADAKAEGVKPLSSKDTGHLAEITGTKYKPAFSFLWDKIYKEYGLGWEKNPWVWAIEFRRIKP